MIRLTSSKGYDEFVAAEAVVRVTELSASSSSVRSLVHLQGAGSLEVREDAAKVAEQVALQLEEGRRTVNHVEMHSTLARPPTSL